MKIVSLEHWSNAVTPEIQERVRNGSACQLTRKYSVFDEEREVAYLALDWWPLHQRTDLILYEVYVPRQFRHQGIGGRILAEVERLASINGYRRVVLTARPLENYPKRKLREWYQKHGFTRLSEGGPDAMGKPVEGL